MAIYFESVMNAKYRLAAPPPPKRIAIGGYPKFAFYDMQDEQLYYFNLAKQEKIAFQFDVERAIREMQNRHSPPCNAATREGCAKAKTMGLSGELCSFIFALLF